MAKGFPKSCRLRKRRDFSAIYAHGAAYRNAGFHLFLRPREDAEDSRIGLTVKRTIGPAVVRNRLRRWAREDFRISRERIRPCFDIVLHYRLALARAGREEFDRLFEHIFRKAGLWRERPSVSR